MKAKVKIFNCDFETYQKVYKDAVKRAFRVDGIEIKDEDIECEIDNLPGDTIQAQRSGKHSRTISIYGNNDELKYIVGFTNTGLDEDKRKEVEKYGGKYKYNNSDWHSNTYICQGINKIFEYYFDSIKDAPGVKLYFYLLDLEEKTYPYNKSNLICYRELSTIGYKILNIDLVDFSNFRELGFSRNENNPSDISYISFNKFANDLLAISGTKKDNIPSYLKKIDSKYDITTENDFETDANYEKTTDSSSILYVYTFKALGAQAYDSMLVIWTLYILAKKENKNVEFEFSREKYNFRLGQENVKMTADFPETVKTLFVKAGLNIHYVTSGEALQQFNRENAQYEIAHEKGIFRNQELFRNNLREKGVPTRCYLCGCELEDILEAAHLWSVADIKASGADVISDAVAKIGEKELLDETNPHHKELFYKKYMLINNGDNGIWLCKNHHGLFDRNYFCFDSGNGKVLIRTSLDDGSKEFFNSTLISDNLLGDTLNNATKCFLEKRNQMLMDNTGSLPYSECAQSDINKEKY